MSELAIQTVDLSRRYSKYTAVNKLKLNITPGSIFGFLGPNEGALKTRRQQPPGLVIPAAGVSASEGACVGIAFHAPTFLWSPACNPASSTETLASISRNTLIDWMETPDPPKPASHRGGIVLCDVRSATKCAVMVILLP